MENGKKHSDWTYPVIKLASTPLYEVWSGPMEDLGYKNHIRKKMIRLQKELSKN
jgi:hypothetical protein